MDHVQVGDYLIKEPTVSDVPELFDLLTGVEDVNIRQIIQKLLKECVFKDGAPLGERYNSIPLKDLRPLIATLSELCGLTEKK